MSKFIVFCLPRSRSAWMAHFLALPGTSVGHDITRHCQSIEDFLTGINSLAGTVETGAMYGWKTLKAKLPGASIAVVRRRADEVLASLARLGVSDFADELYAREAMLECISSLKGVLTLQYEELDSEEGCAKLLRHCTGRELEPEWLEHWKNVNIQIDFRARMEEIVANMSRLQRLRNEITIENARVSGQYRIGLN